MIRGATRHSKSGKQILMVLAVFIALAGLWKAYDFFSQKRAEPVLADVAPEPLSRVLEPIIEDYDHSYTVAEGDVLADVFAGFEIPYSEIVSLEQADSEVFDFRDIQVGKQFFFSLYEPNSDLVLKKVQYQPDDFRVIRADQTSGGWIIEEEKIEYDAQQALASGKIQSSLYLSALDNGVDEKIILLYADMFAWDIDFAIETRAGDTYKILYEELSRNGEFVRTGKVLAGKHVNQGVEFYAFYFVNSDGKGAYYDEEGNAVEKAFLRAPVNYRYVTSGFSSARFHPVLGKTIPHNGVDYAAAAGTPIISVADGVVTRLGWQGAYGNRIEVRHNERYSSQYSHMSAYVKDMKTGDRIAQGEVVGYVGSTGLSTGPHVHFSMTERGSYVDPGKIDVPDGEPVAEEDREEFFKVVEQRLAQLDS